MPRVPIFDGVPTANLAPASAPQIQAPRSVPAPGDPGEGFQQMGQAFTGLGAQVARREQEEKAKLSAAFSRKSYNELRGIADKTLGNFKGLKNDAAFHGAAAAMEAVRKEHKRIFDSMTDEDARDAYDQAAQGLLVSIQSDIDDHARREKERFESETAKVNQFWNEKDAIDSTVKAYEAAAHQDPTKIGPPMPPVSGEQFLHSVIANETEQLQREGIPLDSPVSMSRIRSARARVNEQVVDRLSAAGMLDAAESHLSKAIESGDFDPDAAAKILDRIQKRRVGDAALRQVVEWDAKGIPVPDRVEAVKTSFREGKISADSYRAIMDEMGKVEKQKQDLEDASKRDALASAQRFLSANKLASVDDFALAMPKEYEAIVANGGLPDLYTFAGKRIVTNPQARIKALTMSERELRAYTEGGIEVAFGTLLDEQDMNKLRARYKEATGESTKEGLDIIGREKRLLRGFADTYKDKFPAIDVSNPDTLKSPEIAAQYDKFLGQVQERIDAFEASVGGKKATTDDLQKIMDGMKQERAAVRMSRIGVDWASGDLNINVNSLSEEDRADVYVPTPRGDVYLKDIPVEEEKKITAELSVAANSWIERMRAKGYEVSTLDIPAQYRATPANVVRLWVGAGAIGAAPGSSGASAAPEKLGPPVGPPPDISKLLPSIPEEEALNMTNEQFADRVISEAYQRQGIDKKVRNNFWWMNAGSTNEARKRAEKEISSIQATEDAVRERVRQHIYKKMNVPPRTLSDLWAPSASKVAADREVERVMSKGTGKASAVIEYERLLSEAPARRAAMDQIKEEADTLSKTLGKNHPMVQSYERRYQDLGLVELKMQTLRAELDDNGMYAPQARTSPSQEWMGMLESSAAAGNDSAIQPYGPEEYRITDEMLRSAVANVYGPNKDPSKRYEADTSLLPDIKEDADAAKLKKWFDSYRNKNGSGKESSK